MTAPLFKTWLYPERNRGNIFECSDSAYIQLSIFINHKTVIHHFHSKQFLLRNTSNDIDLFFCILKFMRVNVWWDVIAILFKIVITRAYSYYLKFLIFCTKTIYLKGQNSCEHFYKTAKIYIALIRNNWIYLNISCISISHTIWAKSTGHFSS